jgi:hypothetical protein
MTMAYADGTALKDSEPTVVMDPEKLDTVDAEKLTDWGYEPSIEFLKEDLEYARQDNVDQKANVKGWLDLRNTTGSEVGRKVKVTGRSNVQPKLVRKHNEWRYPALTEPFLNTDRMFQIKPRSHKDKASSRQNELVLNWQFDTKLNKVAFIDKYARKTVDEGTSIVRVGWERKTEKVMVEKPVYEYFQIQDEEQMQVLAQATQYFHDNPKDFETDPDIPDSLRASVEYGVENQIAVYAEEVGVEEVLETRVTYNQPSLKIVDVANFFVDPAVNGDWTEARFMIYTYETTQSDLKKKKIYKNLDKVNWEAARVTSNLGNQDHETNTPMIDTRTSNKKSNVLVYEYWGECDIHQDGVMVPILVTFIGNTIIQMTENPFPDRRPPFVLVPYMPIDGSHFGEADASLLQDNQRVLGAVTRGMVDLLGRSANAQTGYAKDMLDPVNMKRFTAGQDFQFNPNKDPRVNIQQMTYPEIPNSALQMSQLQNAEAEGLSGVKSFSAGITGEAFGKVARGISGALDAAGQREMSILRRLAEGMIQIGRKITSMNAKFLSEEEVIRVTDEEFVVVKRDELNGEFDLIVDISTATVDEAKSQDLGYMLQTMGPDMDPGLSQIILGDIADLKRMPALAERIRAYQPQPDPVAQKLQELQIAELEGKIALEQAKTIKLQAEAENIALDTQMDADGTSHERNVETMGAQASGNRDLEVTKALLKGEAPVGNIEAGVGFNKMTDDADRIRASQKKQIQPAQEQFPGPVPQDPNALPNVLPQEELATNPDLGQIPQ